MRYRGKIQYAHNRAGFSIVAGAVAAEGYKIIGGAVAG